MRSTGSSLGQALLLCALALCAWLPGLWHAEFSFDDREAIEGNPVVEGALPWTAAFTRDYWEHRGAAGHYRPFATLTLRADHALWGTLGVGYRATNLALHLLVLCMASLVLSRLCADQGSWPWIGLAVFAVHPVLADSVAWISGRSSMLAALPGLLAALGILTVLERGVPSARRLGLLAALASAGTCLSFLGKEDGALWALVLTCLATRGGRRAWVCTSLGAAAGLCLVLALRASALGSPWIEAPHAPLAGVALDQRLLLGGRALVEALRLLVWPVGYAPSYAGDLRLGPSASATQLGLGLLGLVAWTAGALWASRSLYRSASLFPASVLVALSAWVPYLQLEPSGEVFAPRFLYLPLLFAAPALHALIGGVCGRFQMQLVSLALLCLCLGAWSRARVYANRGSFCLAVLEQRPRDTGSWNDLGLYYEEQGDPARARSAWLWATELEPSYSRSWSNLGRLELLQGHAARALPLLERAVEKGPSNPVAHHNLGSARLVLGDALGAESAQRQALALAPGLTNAWEGLARALLAQGRRVEAREAIGRWLRLDPQNVRAAALLAALDQR